MWPCILNAFILFGVTCNWVKVTSSPTEHPRNRHSQSPQTDSAVLQFTRWRWRTFWHGQRRWVSTCQFQTVPCLSTLRPPQWRGLWSHWLLQGGETSACLWVHRLCLWFYMLDKTFTLSSYTLVPCSHTITSFLLLQLGSLAGHLIPCQM